MHNANKELFHSVNNEFLKIRIVERTRNKQVYHNFILYSLQINITAHMSTHSFENFYGDLQIMSVNVTRCSIVSLR